MSVVLPAFMYRDPADVVEQVELDTLGCRACVSSLEMLDRVACTDRRNPKQKGVPGVGHRCKYFKERG